MMERRYHLIYVTTCSITGHFYVGRHSTDNIDDGYMGSGKRLSRSLRKYGKDVHQRIVLEVCDDRSSLLKREHEIVSVDLLNDPLCLNLIVGGDGGHHDYAMPADVKRRIGLAHRGMKRTLVTRMNISKARKGQKLSPEALRKRTETRARVIAQRRAPIIDRFQAGMKPTDIASELGVTKVCVWNAVRAWRHSSQS
jgi:hypothetical protein